MKYRVNRNGVDITYDDIIKAEETEYETIIHYVEYAESSDRSVLIRESFDWITMIKDEEIVGFVFGKADNLNQFKDCKTIAHYDI